MNAHAHDRKRIFQVAYREEQYLTRARLLRGRGYAVVSAIGNEAAKSLLTNQKRIHLVIVGHAAPYQTRLEMIGWLREHYLATRILALTQSSEEKFESLRFNAFYHPPEAWLPLLEDALSQVNHLA